ncbi:MAG: UPF0280 family protein [Candidatus Omnitrophota bacterium]
MYQERFYRSQVSSACTLEVSFKETDLLICSDTALAKQAVLEIVKKYYQEIEAYCKLHPEFITSLSSLDLDPAAPPIVQDMLEVCQKTGIGPFAGVAGAIAQYVGNALKDQAGDLIIENGGDIFLSISRDIAMGVYLGDNFSYRAPQQVQDGPLDTLVLRVKKRDTPFGIASSSAYIGHSLNFGKADLVTLVAKSATIADSFVTALSNRVKRKTDIGPLLDMVKQNPDLYGALIAFEGNIFIWGEIEFDG